MKWVSLLYFKAWNNALQQQSANCNNFFLSFGIILISLILELSISNFLWLLLFRYSLKFFFDKFPLELILMFGNDNNSHFRHNSDGAVTHSFTN